MFPCCHSSTVLIFWWRPYLVKIKNAGYHSFPSKNIVVGFHILNLSFSDYIWFTKCKNSWIRTVSLEHLRQGQFKMFPYSGWWFGIFPYGNHQTTIRSTGNSALKFFWVNSGGAVAMGHARRLQIGGGRGFPQRCRAGVGVGAPRGHEFQVSWWGPGCDSHGAGICTATWVWVKTLVP